MYTLCYILCTYFFVERKSTVLFHVTCTVKRFHCKLLQVNFRNIRYIHTTITIIILSMHLHYIDFLHKSMFMSVYRTISVSVQPVWPIVLQGKTLLHISVQCRTATQLLPHLRTQKPHALCCDFPNCRRVTLPVRCWYISLQEYV